MQGIKKLSNGLIMIDKINELEVLDLTNKLFKKQALFLEAMYYCNNKTMKDIVKQSGIPYNKMSDVVTYFEKRGIVKRERKYKSDRIYIIVLTPYGQDLVNALMDLKYTMKHGKRIKQPFLGSDGMLILPINELRNKYGKRRK